MLTGAKKRGNVNEKQLIAESWANLAFDSELNGKGFSPLHDYQRAKNLSKEKREKKAAFQNPKYNQSSRQYKPKP